MDIYQALTHDHNQLKPLLDKLVVATENDQSTKALLDQIRDLLIPHSRAEEAVFYNTLRGFPAQKEQISHSFNEHMQAEVLLRTMRGLEKINIEWTAAAKKLRETIFHHISEEEGKVFDQARQILLAEEAKQLGLAFEEAKRQASQQSGMKNTVDMVANMLPKNLGDRIRSGAENQI